MIYCNSSPTNLFNRHWGMILYKLPVTLLPGACLLLCAALALPANSDELPSITVNGDRYPLVEDQQLPDWLQVEVVVFRHTAVIEERARPTAILGYPSPLLELTDPAALAAEAAEQAEQRGIVLLGEQLNTSPHSPWQAALIIDLTTLYDPFFVPEAPHTQPQPELSSALVEDTLQQPAINIESLTIEPAWQLLDSSELTLRDSARAIGRRSSYELLNHFGWRQPSTESSPWIVVQGGNPMLGRHPLEGAIRLLKSRFHHIETQLWWAELTLQQPDSVEQAAPALDLSTRLQPSLTLPPLPDLLTYRAAVQSHDSGSTEASPWTVYEALQTNNPTLSWQPSLTPTEQWSLNLAPFSLALRVLLDNYRDQPPALKLAYQRAVSAPQVATPSTEPMSESMPESQLVSKQSGFEQPLNDNAAVSQSDSVEFSGALFVKSDVSATPPAQLSGAEEEKSNNVESRQLSETSAPSLRLEQLWTMSERRRVDAGSDYYFDHPAVGLIVRVTEVEPRYTAKPGVELPPPLTAEVNSQR